MLERRGSAGAGGGRDVLDLKLIMALLRRLKTVTIIVAKEDSVKDKRPND